MSLYENCLKIVGHFRTFLVSFSDILKMCFGRVIFYIIVLHLHRNRLTFFPLLEILDQNLRDLTIVVLIRPWNPTHDDFQNGTFFLGAILTITASIWGTILDEDMSYFGVYILGFLFGAGTTTVLVQSLAITAELIGENTNTSAFVYGAMSLTGTLELGQK